MVINLCLSPWLPHKCEPCKHYILSSLFLPLSTPNLVIVSDDSNILFELSVVTNTRHHTYVPTVEKGPLLVLLDLQYSGLYAYHISIEVGCL